MLNLKRNPRFLLEKRRHWERERERERDRKRTNNLKDSQKVYAMLSAEFNRCSIGENTQTETWSYTKENKEKDYKEKKER